MQGRFIKPVYDGEDVTVTATSTTPDSLAIELRNSAGEPRPTARPLTVLFGVVAQ